MSCDYNPIHMDSIAARRTLSGGQIVHGIHSLLWLLDSFCRSDLFRPGATFLKVQFLQPIYVGDEATLEITDSSELVRARIFVGHEEVVAASLSFGDLPTPPYMTTRNRPCICPPESPNDLTLDDMIGIDGCLSFSTNASHIDSEFPYATRCFGIQRVLAILHLSCLVGMIVPGLHSIFSGLSLHFSNSTAGRTDAIQFNVESIVKRFRLVRIGVIGPGVFGCLETQSRMPPVRQARMQDIKQLVLSDEFRGATALVIGGSRGLGELTAKLIAAGGGRVAITYATGKEDASTVVSEINDAGGQCAAITYDVRRSAAAQFRSLDMAPSHLYYFSTPPIFRRKTGIFDAQRFAEFNSFYLHGFYDVVQTIIHLRPEGIRVFYPSSEAIDVRPANMTEYTMSKAAAEILCADLTKLDRKVEVLTRRLPRLPTDQTNSVVQTETKDPISLMLSIVRKMHESK